MKKALVCLLLILLEFLALVCLLLTTRNDDYKVVKYYDNVSMYFYEDDFSFDVFVINQTPDPQTGLVDGNKTKTWHLTCKNCDFITLNRFESTISNRFYIRNNHKYTLVFFEYRY